MSRLISPVHRIGELDQRVELQESSRVKDGQGGYNETWSVTATVWAHVRPMSGGERLRADGTQAEAGYMVVIRFRNDIDESWRVRWINQDKLMNVRFCHNSGTRSMYLPIECERGVGT